LKNEIQLHLFTLIESALLLFRFMICKILKFWLNILVDIFLNEYFSNLILAFQFYQDKSVYMKIVFGQLYFILSTCKFGINYKQ